MRIIKFCKFVNHIIHHSLRTTNEKTFVVRRGIFLLESYEVVQIECHRGMQEEQLAPRRALCTSDERSLSEVLKSYS